MKENIMHKSLSISTLLALLTLTGCGQGTPGGPGVTSTTVKKPVFGQTDDTFNLSVPMMATSLQQGSKLETQIGIERAKNFGEDVALKFVGLPKGVQVTPTAPVIKHGDENAKITFAADADAMIGEYKVRITGLPESGNNASIEFSLNITAIDTFTLSTPRLSTSLKQNESKSVSIGISRDKTFASDVELQFGELPTGVTMVPDSPVLKQGEDDVNVTFTAASDAALGDFTITITGHPSTGLDATRELKLSVVSE